MRTNRVRTEHSSTGAHEHKCFRIVSLLLRDIVRFRVRCLAPSEWREGEEEKINLARASGRVRKRKSIQLELTAMTVKFHSSMGAREHESFRIVSSLRSDV